MLYVTVAVVSVRILNDAHPEPNARCDDYLGLNMSFAMV